VATSALRTGALPRWLAISAAVIAPVLLASVAGGNQAPPVGFLLGFAWFIAASVVLLRPSRALRRGALAHPTAP
jgi:thiamine transporter ThiT